MVIEPDVLVRTTIAAYLRECGYKVIEGVVAGDLWRILDSSDPLDLVFSEVQLSGQTDGFVLARRLRQTRPEIDLILVSETGAAAERSKRSDEERPMKKPYRLADVAARIRVLLQRRRAAGDKS
jgi:DNA-binding response OmpR family regulator